MKMAYTTSRLLLLALLAVCVSYTNGAGALYDTCKVDADCTVSNGICLLSKECTLGVCFCPKTYGAKDGVCKPLKNIGETCDSNSKCIDGDCTGGTCVCPSGDPPSADKKNCGRVFGESCASNSECDNEMKCLSSTCGCETTTQHVVKNAYIKTEDLCVHKDATVNVAASGSCSEDSSSSTAKYCNSAYFCGSCPEATSSLNKICRSGARDVSASMLTIGVIVSMAIVFVRRH